MLTTYSMWNLFRNCRKACEWRYIRELVPQEQAATLRFGSLIHECLEQWHRDRDLDAVFNHIDRSCSDRAADSAEKQAWHNARAMMQGYADRHPAEEFEVVALEKCFEGRIVNPETGVASRSFMLAGKVDGIVRIGGNHYLLEHKTTAQLSGDYLERLWIDFQITLYSWYVEETLGIRITGVLYNILVKAKLKQGQGETQAEFESRRAGLVARSKTGRSAAHRKLPESDDAYAARLAVKYASPELFHREKLYLSRDQMVALQAELWELTQAFLDARHRNVFYQNTSFCFHYHRPCAYFPLCRSGGNTNLIENLYRKVPPHEELREGSSQLNKVPF